MRIKSIVAAAGVVLLATLGAAQAGDSFDVLSGVEASAMSQADSSGITGSSLGVVNISLFGAGPFPRSFESSMFEATTPPTVTTGPIGFIPDPLTSPNPMIQVLPPNPNQPR